MGGGGGGGRGGGERCLKHFYGQPTSPWVPVLLLIQKYIKTLLNRFAGETSMGEGVGWTTRGRGGGQLGGEKKNVLLPAESGVWT